MPTIPIIKKDIDFDDVQERIQEKLQPISDKLQLQLPEKQKRLVLIIVCIALLLDNMLYMVIVPIIPVYLNDLYGPVEVSPSAAAQIAVNDAGTPISLGDGNISFYSNGTERLKKYHMMPMYKGNDRNEDASIGWLFASKAVVQLLVNPFSGSVIDKYGYDRPMILGLAIIFLSTSTFAFGQSYAVLFIARSLQGVGSAFADTSGLAMIAAQYTEETERSKALGIALAFISFGSLFAPPFGGILYEFGGKCVPFLFLALIALVDAALLFLIMKPVRQERDVTIDASSPGVPMYKLIMDPYIAVCAGCLVMANISLAFLEPTIAMWMKESFKASEWEIGMVWLPAFFPHVLGVYLTVQLMQRYYNQQWLIAAIGLMLEGFSCLIIPYCRSFGGVIVPIMIDCLGIALVDTAILPLLGFIVDTRHASVYGSIYAIADISYCLAYSFGPIIAGSIVMVVGFTWLNIGIFISNFAYAPLMLFVRRLYKYDQFENEELDAGSQTGSYGGMQQTTDQSLQMNGDMNTKQQTGGYGGAVESNMQWATQVPSGKNDPMQPVYQQQNTQGSVYQQNTQGMYQEQGRQRDTVRITKAESSESESDYRNYNR